MAAAGPLSGSLVMIGNPGTGKSTLLNTYAGVHLFDTGPSGTGTGITFQLGRKPHNGRWFMDTPGLADLNLRKQAAEAINKALECGGTFSVVFVLSTEEGRIRPDDLTTMNLVFAAVNSKQRQITQDGYAILVNKCKRKWLKMMTDETTKEAWIANLSGNMQKQGIPVTRFVHFAPLVEELDCEVNAMADLDVQTLSFLDRLPVCHILPAAVERIRHENWDEQREMLEKQIAELEKELQSVKNAAAAAQRELKEERDKMSKRLDNVKKDVKEDARREMREELKQERDKMERKSKMKKIRHYAGLYFHPEDRSLRPANGTKVVLLAGSSTDASDFMLVDWGTDAKSAGWFRIEHAGGKCICPGMPNASGAKDIEREVVLRDYTGNIEFAWRWEGPKLKNAKEHHYLHPWKGSEDPDNGTKLATHPSAREDHRPIALHFFVM